MVMTSSHLFRRFLIVVATLSALDLVARRLTERGVVVMGLSAVALMFISFIRYRVGLARAERARVMSVADNDTDKWVDCDARYVSADGHLISECHERKDHDGPHRAIVESEWS